MDSIAHRCLLVDDEPMVRALLMRAFRAEGFETDVAIDGVEAETLLSQRAYDVLVTDLRMPRKHGHALICDLLTRERRPRIFVLTAVAEPRLAKDLLTRGVDDIDFKPVDFPTFAAKVRTVLSRGSSNAQESEQPNTSPAQTPPAVSEDEMAAAMQSLWKTFPVSERTLGVYEMASSEDFSVRDMAQSIMQHDVLSNEIINIANTPFYNRDGKHITDLNSAVVRLGKKRVGQLALGANAIAAVSPENFPWLDLSRFWQHCVASGIALELLVNEGQHQEISDGLLVCATLQDFGRLVAGSFYPEHYRRAIEIANETHMALQQLERSMFPSPPPAIMLEVLEQWGIPRDPHSALPYVELSFAELNELDEPIRSRTELVKLAGWLAQTAMGYWEPWGVVDLPSIKMLDRLRLFDLASILRNLKKSCAGINSFQIGSSAKPRQPTPLPKLLAYHVLESKQQDLLPFVMESMGVDLTLVENAQFVGEHILVNCIESSGDELARWMYAQETKNLVSLVDAACSAECSQLIPTLTLPVPVSSLWNAIRFGTDKPLVSSSNS